MAIYGVAVLPVIELMHKLTVKQKWCAADGNEAGMLENLLNFFKDFSNQGKHFSYTVIAPIDCTREHEIVLVNFSTTFHYQLTSMLETFASFR